MTCNPFKLLSLKRERDRAKARVEALQAKYYDAIKRRDTRDQKAAYGPLQTARHELLRLEMGR